jgi:hypothetical protein
MMERLTFRDSKGDVWIKDAAHVDEQGQICMLSERLAQYEDTGLTPGDCEAYAKGEAEKRIVVFENYEHLKEVRNLIRAQAQGRLAEVTRCGDCSKQFLPDCPMQIIEKHQQIFICQNDNDYCSFGESKADQTKEVSK